MSQISSNRFPNAGNFVRCHKKMDVKEPVNFAVTGSEIN
jgi:hypothetical protein